MNYTAIYIKGEVGCAHRFKELFGGSLLIAPNVNSAIKIIKSKERETGFIFYEQGSDLMIDVQQIRFLKSWFSTYGIVLVTGSRELTSQERCEYLQSGVGTAIKGDIDAETFEQTMRLMQEFLFERTADDVIEPHEVKLYRIPLWKRSFDILASGTALLLLSPLLLGVALAIRLDSPGPILYKSKRVGSNYRVFEFLKFRSMRPDADQRIKDYSDLNQYAEQDKADENAGKITLSSEEMAEILKNMEDGMLLSDDFLVDEKEHLQQIDTQQENAFVKIENDPRITRLGRFLRKYSIDELPQLFNILRGDMSVVGNRPLPLYEAENLTSDEYIERFMCSSGLTGLWQVEKRGGAGKMSPEQRKQLDIRYAQEMSFLLDIRIILRTFTAFIQKENV